MKNLLIPFNAMLGSEGRKPVVPILHESIKEFILIPPAEPKCPPIDSLRLLPIVEHSSADNIGCYRPFMWRECFAWKQHICQRNSKHGAHLHKGRARLHRGKHLQHKSSPWFRFGTV